MPSATLCVVFPGGSGRGAAKTAFPRGARERDPDIIATVSKSSELTRFVHDCGRTRGLRPAGSKRIRGPRREPAGAGDLPRAIRFWREDRVIGVGATLNQRFTLDKELGQGGMGTVYRATDRVLGRNVAIKFLKETGTERGRLSEIRLEAQILARLVHDKIVRLYDFRRVRRGHCFLVMEEVNGPSFAGRLRDLRSSTSRLRICGQVAEALDYAHIQGVVHRDVKPGNVLLTTRMMRRSSPTLVCRSSLAIASDQSGMILRHPELHEPRAGPGQVARPSHRPVFRGCDGLRMR